MSDWKKRKEARERAGDALSRARAILEKAKREGRKNLSRGEETRWRNLLRRARKAREEHDALRPKEERTQRTPRPRGRVPGPAALSTLRSLYRDQLTSVAVHEAAHAVAFLELGFGLRSVRLHYRRANGPGGIQPAGGVCVPEESPPASMTRREQRRAEAVVQMSGAVAEERRWGRRFSRWSRRDEREDVRLLRLAGGGSLASVKADARALVRKHERPIGVVALRLLQEGELSGDDVRRVLGERSGRRTAAA